MSEPMADDEILDLLSATIHGPLPHATMMRVFATLAEVPDLREKAASDFSPIRWSEMLRQKDEALDAATERAKRAEGERDRLKATADRLGTQLRESGEATKVWRMKARDKVDPLVARCTTAERERDALRAALCKIDERTGFYTPDNMKAVIDDCATAARAALSPGKEESK